MVKSGSSYLSQSELALTFGLGRRDRADRLVIEWPSGAKQEFRNVPAGSTSARRAASSRPRFDSKLGSEWMTNSD